MLEESTTYEAVRSLSIIICTWNRSNSLDATLRSIETQKLPESCIVEVIVVDNNSTDNTKEVVRNYQSKWSFGQLRYLREERQGKQFALNLAIRNAIGDVLAFTDDDVFFCNDWAIGIVNCFRSFQIDLAGGKTIPVWPGNESPTWFQSSMQAVVAGVDCGDVPLIAPLNYYPAGTNLSARGSLFKKIGLFSEAHFRHMDYEFGLRAQISGASIAYRPELVVYAPVDPSIINMRYFRRWYFKLGIASAIRSLDTSPRFFGVPRWMLRTIVGDAFKVVYERLRWGVNYSFKRETRLFELLGHVCSVWYSRLYPTSHARWVVHRSQKKGGTFG